MQNTLEAPPPTQLAPFTPKFTRPFSSWPAGGRPPGFYRLPLPETAASFYRENGYLVVEDCIPAEEVAELRKETTRVCRGERGVYGGITASVPGETDDEVLRRYLCIHFPHKISDTMMRYVAHPSYIDVLTRIIGPNVKCMQSMLFIKASGKPGQAWHQDEFYIPTRDTSLTGGWLAMDDATVENGCLWILPGSHRRKVIYPQQRHDDRRFDCSGVAWQFPYRDEDSVPVEVKSGSLVFFNGYLLHRSLPNHAKTGYRRVLVNHYMSAESLLPWRQPRDGESMATADDRDIIMIAGEDPYAWKGTVNEKGVYVRPSGEGGCIDSNTKIASEVATK
ncbi:MAG: phytanoyl-CoA dioxygenase family protein [Methylacidiphilales bacterium]|nr:phytanoyl-CoA dioxygenase family protein [Candidatus Methylacidiphilales bacterium]